MPNALTITTMKAFVKQTKMMPIPRIMALICVVALCGCATVQPVLPEAQTITLDKSYTRNLNTTIGSTILPAGVYRPSFQTERGVYYEAPSSVILGRSPCRGGLFLPNSPDEKQACWFDFLPKHRYTFDEPIPYRR